MPASSFEIEPLLAPLADDAPCGPALDHDPDFQALERAAAGKPEVQYGDKVYPAEPPDWLAVFEAARALAERTRDVRLAIWLARSGARLRGLAGALNGLQLLRGLLEQYWDHVHPQLDAEDNNDPTMRLNALLPLYTHGEFLADLRAAGLAEVRGSMTLRDLELGLGQDEPAEGESVPTETGVLQALEDLLAAQPEVADHLRGAQEAAEAIAASVESAVGSQAPESAPLARLLRVGTNALSRLQGEGEAAAEGDAATGDDGATGAGGGGAGGGGALRTRADALRELDRICEWFERHEPSHPAPLLIRRAQRLMKMSFIEIIRDMAPAGFEQVQNIAGAQPESEAE